MAELDSTIGGEFWEKYFSRNKRVSAALDYQAFAVKARAQALLAEHRQEGHSFIEVTNGRVDRYVVLNDTQGQAAAMSIEYGRAPSRRKKTDGEGNVSEVYDPGHEGLFILHRAAGITPKNTGRVKVK